MAIDDSLAQFRAAREDIERAVLPLAGSIDGIEFTFQASLHGLALQTGGYAVIETDDGSRLGQVLAVERAAIDAGELDLPGHGDGGGVRTRMTVRHAAGRGEVLEGPGTPFHDARVRPAEPGEVRDWIERSAPVRARLPVGELALAPGVAYALDAGGFGRHTFMCGQSGSGKTYALGVLLEQLLLHTALRMVVLDPNSDFVRMQEVRAGTEPALAERYAAAAAGVAVHRASTGLRLRLADLEPAARAGVLQLDPVADREEHAEFDALLAAEQPPSLDALADSDHPAARRLAMRVRNLGVDRYGVWARERPGSTLDELDAGRGLVVDLGSQTTRAEQSLTAAAVLEALWRRRERREPVLIVIDEAHNVCPAEPDDGLTALATEHAVRIAAEGRKFGLYLLVSTQRPQKVHPNVVTQCDNLVLMRLNSAADAAYAQAVFSFVPAGLLARARSFGLGEALVAGKLSPHAALLKFGARVAEEGGADVAAEWAQER
jgi:DNA helicase HerA-like ATPase